MELNITKKTEKVLLQRSEIEGDMVFQGAVPSREELRKKIASKEGTTDDLVIIKSIHTMHGYGKANFIAYTYKNESAMKNIEYAYIQNRGKPKQAGAEKAAPAAEAK